MSWLIGADVGASHIEAAIAEVDAHPKSRVRRAGTIVKPGRIEQAAETIAATIGVLTQDIGVAGAPDCLVVGAAGTHTEVLSSDLGESLRGFFADTQIHITTDGAIALEAAFGDRPGIVVSAGSGSIAYARTPGKDIRRVGGLGPELADEGSGYAIGRAGLRAAARAADGRPPNTTLANSIQIAVGVTNLDELVDWAWEADRPAVARLAETVCSDAMAGDETAQTIVRSAANDLGALVLSLAAHFGEGSSIDVAFSGGVLDPESPVKYELIGRLRERLPAAKVLEMTVDPVLGALSMASRLTRD